MYSSNGWHTLATAISSEYANKAATFSLEIMCLSGESTEYCTIYFGAGNGYIVGSSYISASNCLDTWVHVSGNMTFGSTPYFGILVRGNDNQGKKCTILVRNLKVETGSLESIWTPAPTDIGFYGMSNDSNQLSLEIGNITKKLTIDYATTAGSANAVAWDKVSSKPATATRWPSWSEVTSKPTTFTPSSHEHTYIKSLGDVAPETGRTHTRGGVYAYRPYSNRGDGAPSNYGAVIGFGNGTAGAGEIWVDWCGAGIWYRRLRDCCEDWSGWTKFIDANNIGSQSVSYATSAGSATSAGKLTTVSKTAWG